MEEMKTVHVFAVLEMRIPQEVSIRNINLGLAGSKILSNFDVIEKAELLTWWVDHVVPCNSRYITCPKCSKIELVCADTVILDGKPLCIMCSADFRHGDLPVPRTPEDIKRQIGGGFSAHR